MKFKLKTWSIPKYTQECLEMRSKKNMSVKLSDPDNQDFYVNENN